MSGLTLAGDVHDVVAELVGKGLGHGVHAFSDASQRHRSGVTYPCSSPLVLMYRCVDLEQRV
jgi:hypothetical protein